MQLPEPVLCEVLWGNLVYVFSEYSLGSFRLYVRLI